MAKPHSYFKTVFTKYPTRCPQCRKYFDFEEYTQININLNPELMEKLEDGSLFESACECGYKKKQIDPFLYFDEEHHFLSIFQTHQLLKVQSLLSDLQEIEFPKEMLTGIHFREIDDYDDFIEKIQIFASGYTDREIEMAKYLTYINEKDYLKEKNFVYFKFELSPKREPQLVSYNGLGNVIDRLDCALIPGLFGQIRKDYDLSEEGVYKIDWDWAKETYDKKDLAEQKEIEDARNNRSLPYSSTYKKAPSVGFKHRNLSDDEKKEEIHEAFRKYENTPYEMNVKNWCVCEMYNLSLDETSQFRTDVSKPKDMLEKVSNVKKMYSWKDDENGTLEEKLDMLKTFLLEAWKYAFLKEDVADCFAGFAFYFMIKQLPREEYINLAIESAYRGTGNTQRMSVIPKEFKDDIQTKDFKAYEKQWKLPTHGSEKVRDSIWNRFNQSILTGDTNGAVYFLNLIHNYCDDSANEVKHLDEEINRLLKDCVLDFGEDDYE